jgi:phenylalanyl-tRNA synthetase beta chain
MGGASSEISDTTVSALLEAAWFNPMAIARSSKRLGLRSEASARFERGVDHGGVDRAVARFVELATELAGATVAGAADFSDAAHLPPAQRIRLRVARVNEILGTDLSADAVAGYLEPIGFATTRVDDGTFDVNVPSYRPDVNAGEINLIEEVARHLGYENIAKTLPASRRLGGLTAYQTERRAVRAVLVGRGLDEAVTSVLIGPGDHSRAGLAEDGIEADRPMLREESILRTSMLPGLLRAVAYNASHRNGDVALFEVGPVFHRPPDVQPLPLEHERLTAVLAGAGAIEATDLLHSIVDAMRVADVRLERAAFAGIHPGRSARIDAGGTPIGAVGEVDPDVLRAWDIESTVGWLDLDLAALLAAPRRPIAMRPVSRFPTSDIDLAFAVPDTVPAAAVEDALRTAAGELLADIGLFDVFRGSGVPEGARSLAYHLRFQAPDRTLTDEEVGAVRQRCIDAVVASCDAQLR